MKWISHPKPLSLLLVSAISCLSCSLVMAYVPPPEYQIQQMVKKHPQRSVRVRSRLSDGSVVLKETLWYDGSTRLLRGRVTNEADETVYTYQKKLGETGITASSILFETNANAFLKALANEGVDLTAKAPGEDVPMLGRVRQSVGWIIGRGSPSLWVLKDDFFPLRWNPKSGDDVAVTFEETRFQRDLPYSRLITVTEEGKETLRLAAIEVSLNPDLSDIKSQVFDTGSSPRLKVIQDLLKWIR